MRQTLDDLVKNEAPSLMSESMMANVDALSNALLKSINNRLPSC